MLPDQETLFLIGNVIIYFAILGFRLLDFNASEPLERIPTLILVSVFGFIGLQFFYNPFFTIAYILLTQCLLGYLESKIRELRRSLRPQDCFRGNTDITTILWTAYIFALSAIFLGIDDNKVNEGILVVVVTIETIALFSFTALLSDLGKGRFIRKLLADLCLRRL